MTLFRKNNIICIVEKNNYESEDNFIKRGNFVVSQSPKNDQEYKQNVIYSNIYINHIHLNCQYDTKIMNNLEKMINNLNL